MTRWGCAERLSVDLHSAGTCSSLGSLALEEVMNKVAGLHHLAICTANMKEQIEFFTDKLGMELQALYWMHGVETPGMDFAVK